MSITDAFDESTWTVEQRLYFKYVDRTLKSGKRAKFSNGQPWHAVYLIAAFFREAREHVRLFSGTLTRKTPDGVSIYEHSRVADAAAGFLMHPKSKITIVLEKDIDVDENCSAEMHPFVKNIRDLSEQGQIRGQLEIWKANEDDLKFLRENNFLYHMMIMDKKAWRIETNPDPDNVKAHVGVGDKSTARSLSRIFDEILCSRSDKVLAIPA